jgi:hypothetical protein
VKLYAPINPGEKRPSKPRIVPTDIENFNAGLIETPFTRKLFKKRMIVTETKAIVLIEKKEKLMKLKEFRADEPARKFKSIGVKFPP